MSEPIAWVLNLDAELELIDPAYRRSPRMLATIRDRVGWLVPRIRAATGAEVVVVDPDLATPTAFASRGDAWCPTPVALARLDHLGVPAPAAPGFDVLRTVNHRAFAASLDVALPGARFVTSGAALRETLATAPDRPWLLKRPLGFSGRMRKVVVPDRIDAAAETWILASMGAYGVGLQVEPLVDRVSDFSLHGSLAPSGGAIVGEPVVMSADEAGGFVDARVARPAELGPAEREALHAAVAQVAVALHAAGYFGPFGIDAFRWRDAAGALHFHPLVEVNARYTMAWWLGMGERARR